MKAKRKKAENVVTKELLQSQISELIAKADLAKMLGVTVKTLSRWNQKGVAGVKLPKVKIGGQVYYRPADVDEFRRVVR